MSISYGAEPPSLIISISPHTGMGASTTDSTYQESGGERAYHLTSISPHCVGWLTLNVNAIAPDSAQKKDKSR